VSRVRLSLPGTVVFTTTVSHFSQRMSNTRQPRGYRTGRSYGYYDLLIQLLLITRLGTRCSCLPPAASRVKQLLLVQIGVP
jgi:hypothetical protein